MNDRHTTEDDKALGRLMADMRRIPVGKATLYELAAFHPDGRRVLIAYTRRKCRQSLYGAITDDRRREALIRFFGTDRIDFRRKAADGLDWGGWNLRWTGRTQREAVTSELPYAPELVAVEAVAPCN